MHYHQNIKLILYFDLKFNFTTVNVPTQNSYNQYDGIIIHRVV